MIFNKLLRERNINEILGTLDDKIKRCRTEKGVGLLEDLEYKLTEELNKVQNWLNDY